MKRFLEKFQLYRYLFAMVLTTASFTSNATIITAIATGNWNQNSTWSAGTLPVAGDTIVIPNGFTVTVTDQVSFALNGTPTLVSIFGQLKFQNGKKLILPCGSFIVVQTGGTVTPGSGGGMSNYIEICNIVYWSASTGTVSGPLTWGNNPLPVQWLNIEVNNNGVDVANIIWSTFSEVNNDYFTVERSKDGKIFTPVGRVDGHGTTSQTNHYQLTDYNPIQGTSYYQIRQTDFNGINYLSRIIPFTSNKNFTEIIVYPNPSAGILMVRADVNHAQEDWDIKIYDHLGMLVEEKKRHFTIDKKELEISDGINLASGRYTVVITNSEGIKSYPVVIQKMK